MNISHFNITSNAFDNVHGIMLGIITLNRAEGKVFISQYVAYLIGSFSFFRYALRLYLNCSQTFIFFIFNSRRASTQKKKKVVRDLTHFKILKSEEKNWHERRHCRDRYRKSVSVHSFPHFIIRYKDFITLYTLEKYHR